MEKLIRISPTPMNCPQCEKCKVIHEQEWIESNVLKKGDRNQQYKWSAQKTT